MSRGKKLAIAALILLALIVLAVAIIVPRLVNLDRYRPGVIANIERGTGRSVEIGRLSLSVLPVIAVRADNIEVGNPPGFPAGHLLDIKRAEAVLDARALLDRRIVVRSLDFEYPNVSLVSTSDGHWNTEAPARAVVRPAAWTPEATSSERIAKVNFEHGRVTVSNALPSGAIQPPAFAADEVAVELDDVNPEALGLDLTASLPCGARILRAATPLPRIARFRPALLQTDDRASLAVPPGALAAHGTFSAKSAQFGGAAAANLKSRIELRSGGVMLRQISMNLAGGQATGEFVWNSAAEPASYGVQASLAKVDLARLLAGFPGASGKITGTLDGQLDLMGFNLPSADPLANKEGQGRLTVRNGTLPSLQLNRNLMELMKNVLRVKPESGDASSFQSISADLEIGGGEIHSRQIAILGNGMDIDASGALALAGEGRLDYQGVSKMSARRNGFEGIVAGLLGSKVSADGRIDVPFTITGTLDRPRFALKNSPLFH
jgi:uncharacterized protein involved in outer membrane biogenesis